MADKDFSLYLLRQSISTLGDWTYYFALTIYIYRVTHQPAALGLLTLMYTLPGVFMGPVAGFLADRISRKTIIILTDILRSVVMFCLPFLTNIVFIYLLVLLEQTLADISNPSNQALVYEIIKDESSLMSGNAYIAAGNNLGRILGGVVGTMTLSLFGLKVPFWTDSLSFISSAILLLFVNLKCARSDEPEHHNGIQYFTAGLRDVKQIPLVKHQIIWSMLVMVPTSLISTFLVVYIENQLQLPGSFLGIFMALQAVGVVLSTVALPFLTRKFVGKQLFKLYRLLFSLFSFLLVLLMFVHFWYISAILILVFGGLEIWFGVVTQTVIQTFVINERQGRVFGILNSLVNVSFLVSSMGGGYLIGAIGLKAVFLISGGVLTLLGIFSSVKATHQL